MAIIKRTTFSESNINVTKNTSSLTINIYFSANNQSTWFESAKLTCKCNGVTQSKNVSHPLGGSASASFTFNNIAHNNNGSKSVGWSWNCPTGTSVLGTVSDSGTKALTTIKRLATVTSATNFTDTTNPTIQFTNPANFPLYPYINLWTSSGGTQLGSTIRPNGMSSSGAKISSPYTWNLTEAQRNQIRDWLGSRPNAYATVGVNTMNGTSSLGSSSKGVTLTNVLEFPTFENYEYADINPNTLAITGNDPSKIVKGYSTLQVSIPVVDKATAHKGATMSHYLINGERVEYSDLEDISKDFLNWNGSTNTLEVQAVDSRGLATLLPKDLIIADYTPLQAGSISLARDGNVSKETRLSYNGSGKYLLPNNTQNTITATYQFKKTNDSTYTTGTTNINPSVSNDDTFSFPIGNNVGYIAGDLGAEGFSIDDSFNLIVTVSDVLSSVQYTTTLNSGIPAIAVKGNNIAFHGGYDEDNDANIQLNGKASLNGGKIYGEYVLYHNGDGDNGTITLSDSAENYAYIEIFYRTNDWDYDSTKVYSANGKRANLFAVRAQNATPRVYQKTRTVYINGTTISTYNSVTYAEFINNNNSAGALTATNNIWIVRVVGYK